MSSNTCPTLEVADLLGKKWTMPLLQQIELHGGKGFNELMRRMKKVSPKIMTLRLKALEEQDIIKKEVTAADALRTAYFITEKGKELQAILAQLRMWSQKHCHVEGCTQKECIRCEQY